MSRISRDDMFMAMAQTVALRGTCPRAQVGAILVQDYRPISIGYNGAPPGLPHCLEVGCDETLNRGCQRTIHAEANSLIWAARAGISTEGAIMYSTYSPCRKCAELMAGARISRLIYLNDYRAAELDLLERMGISVIKYDADDTRLHDR